MERYKKRYYIMDKALIFQNEELYRTIIETSQDLIWIIDEKGRFAFFNKSCEEKTGTALTNLIGQDYSCFIPEKDVERMSEIFQKTMKGETLTYEIITPDTKGKELILSVCTAPLYKDGKIKGTVSFGRDITEKRKVDDELKQSEEKYRTLINNIQDGVFIIQDGKFQFVNEAFACMGGYRVEEIMGSDFKDMVAPEDLQMVSDNYSRRQAGQVVPSEYEFRVLHKNGNRIIVNMNVGIINYQGRVASMGTLKNITERRMAEETLKESEERNRRLVDFSPYGIVIHSDDKFVFMNLAGAKILGSSNPYEFVGRSIYDFVHPDYHKIVKNRVRMQEKGKVAPLIEERFLRVDGTHVDVEMVAIPITYKGKLAKYGIFKDITERKKFEEIRRENERILHGSRIKSEFFSIMSHEIRTPLTSIIGYSELLKDKQVAGDLTEKQEYFVDKVLKNSDHLLNIISDILDQSKIEAGKTELVIETFSLPDAIDETIALIKEMSLKNNIVIKKEFEQFDIEADKKRFKQITLNLLNNALKFSKEGRGTITIHAKRSGEMAQISISDTGIGIKKEDMGRLFTTFEQLESGLSRKYMGVGLGLAISKKLVELHGGEIQVKSKYGAGSTFTFYLPLKQKL